MIRNFNQVILVTDLLHHIIRLIFARHHIYWQHFSPPTPGARATARRRGLHARARLRQASRASTAAACSGRAALRVEVATAEQRGVCVGQRGRRDALRRQRRCTRTARRVRTVRRSLRGEGGRGEGRGGPGPGEGAPPPCGGATGRRPGRRRREGYRGVLLGFFCLRFRSIGLSVWLRDRGAGGTHAQRCSGPCRPRGPARARAPRLVRTSARARSPLVSSGNTVLFLRGVFNAS
jgi:hypothetical protein